MYILKNQPNYRTLTAPKTVTSAIPSATPFLPTVSTIPYTSSLDTFTARAAAFLNLTIPAVTVAGIGTSGLQAGMRVGGSLGGSTGAAIGGIVGVVTGMAAGNYLGKKASSFAGELGASLTPNKPYQGAAIARGIYAGVLSTALFGPGAGLAVLGASATLAAVPPSWYRP